jgi:hypothetical protein
VCWVSRQADGSPISRMAESVELEVPDREGALEVCLALEVELWSGAVEFWSGFVCEEGC